MASQKIHLAILRHYRRAKTLGKTVAETWGEEDIHQFRVEVKKLRACLRLAGATHTGIKARLPGKLHVFYSMVGIIRCLQLQRKELEDAAIRLKKELPDSCSGFIEGRIDTAVTVIKEYVNLNFPLGKPRAEWHVPVHGHEMSRGTEAFIRGKREFMLVGQSLPDELGLHAMRKAMKDILYAWSGFSDDDILLLPENWRSIDKLRVCAGVLGEFHDICIQLQLFQDSHFLLSAEDEAGALFEEIRQLWLKDKEDKLDELRHLLLPADDVRKENPLAPGDLKAESYELHVD